MVEDSGAKTGTGTIRPLALPEAVKIEADNKQQPVAVSIDGEWLTMQVLERWRIDDEWWRENPVSRAYFEVVLSNGLRSIFFLDLIGGQWYRQQQA